jgi:hypothetical protein
MRYFKGEMRHITAWLRWKYFSGLILLTETSQFLSALPGELTKFKVGYVCLPDVEKAGYFYACISYEIKYLF